MILKTACKTISYLALLTASSISSAAMIAVAVINGNDSGSEISAIVDKTVFQIAKVDSLFDYDGSEISFDGLTITGTSATTGTWSYSGINDIKWLAIKYGKNYGLYKITDGDVSGNWDIIELENVSTTDSSGAKVKKDGRVQYNSLSHAAVYSAIVVPVPATGWLFLSGLAGIVTVARRKQEIQES